MFVSSSRCASTLRSSTAWTTSLVSSCSPAQLGGKGSLNDRCQCTPSQTSAALVSFVAECTSLYHLFLSSCSRGLTMSLMAAGLTELFRPIFHTLLLIWKHSRFYNTAGRLVTLIREVCNDLIMQTCKFTPGGSPAAAACLSASVQHSAWLKLSLTWALQTWRSCCRSETAPGD